MMPGEFARMNGWRTKGNCLPGQYARNGMQISTVQWCSVTLPGSARHYWIRKLNSAGLGAC